MSRAWWSGKPGRTAYLAALALILCLARTAYSQNLDPSVTNDRPVLKVNLHSYGFSPSSLEARLPIFVDFTDSNHIAIAWQTYDDPSEARRIKFFDTVAMHLHVLVLDAIAGKKEVLQDWPAPARDSRFVAQNDGKFITCIEGTLRLYSSNVELLRTMQTDDPRNCLRQFEGSPGISPARNWMLAVKCNNRTECAVALLNSKNLETEFHYVDNRRIADLSDHWFIATDFPSEQIFVRKFDEPWKPFRSPWLDELQNASIQPRNRPHPVPFFVGDEILLVENSREMAVLDVHGIVLLQGKMPENRRYGPPARSTAGKRFAIVEQQMRGVSNDFWDVSAFPADERVVVFDLSRREAIFAVRVNGNSPWPLSKSHKNKIALSPKGDLLAILSDNILSVYQIPKIQE